MSNNKDKRCQDDLSYLCTENKGNIHVYVEHFSNWIMTVLRF
jgi:hypothetical protein